MNWKDVNEKYIDIIKKDPVKYEKDYQLTLEKVANSRTQYKGKPVPFLYHPMLFTEKDVKDIEKIGDTMMSITNKVTQRYIDYPEFRKKFGYTKELEELILVDNGYDINVPIGRFDIFYKDYDNFKFCELNTDGSSAMNEDNGISEILMESKAFKKLGESYNISYFKLIDKWVEDSLDIFKKWDNTIENPNVAIVDFKESGTSEEFKLFQESYTRKGSNTIIVDPRDLEYRNGSLYFEDFKIDLVYRRMVTFEIIKNIEEIPDFIQAYKEKAFCCIGSIKSQIVHNKIIFKVLHDEETLEFLSEEEQEYVKNHIPYTGEFKGGDSIYEKVLNNKNEYIMKPLDLNAARGVYTGRDLSQEEWKKRLDDSWNNDYIYQEYIDAYLRDFVVFEDGKVKVEKFGSIVGIFMYKEKFAGFYTRVGKDNIISGLSSYFTVPNIQAKPR